MLISTKATDTIYQEIVQILKQHEIDEKESLQQHVLLNDSTFIGYRFSGDFVQVEWLAQSDEIVVKNRSGNILFRHIVSVQKNSRNDSDAENSSTPAAA